METLAVNDDDVFFRAVHAAEILKQTTGRACTVVQRRLPVGTDALFRGSAQSRQILEQVVGVRVQAAA